MKQLGTYLADTLTEDGQISKEQQAIYAYLFDYLIEALLYDVCKNKYYQAEEPEGLDAFADSQRSKLRG